MKLFLIGLPGVGKSYFGEKLAQLTKTDFFDMDNLIEQQLGMSIPEIFEKNGEEYFREVEAKVLTDLIDQKQACVISTGGGTPCFHKGIEQMLKHGKVIYLQASIAKIKTNLSSNNEATKRPLLQEDKLADKLNQLLAVRESVYKKAGHIINMDQPENKILDEMSRIITF